MANEADQCNCGSWHLASTLTLLTRSNCSFLSFFFLLFFFVQAHNIKNFKSQRWQTLLHFRTHRRLLLTGTPLQNSVSELWSLMHFLMPNIFQSQTEFKEWFSNPVAAMVEGKEAVNQKLLTRLHGILRPFLLRRLKTTVAQQLPAKFEHVLTCKMSKRQRFLYEDFMAASDTQRTLASGNFMGMMNVVMSLRKVCNHPGQCSPHHSRSARTRTRRTLPLPLPLLSAANLMTKHTYQTNLILN